LYCTERAAHERLKAQFLFEIGLFYPLNVEQYFANSVHYYSLPYIVYDRNDAIQAIDFSNKRISGYFGTDEFKNQPVRVVLFLTNIVEKQED
jgi:hypothetical protein